MRADIHDGPEHMLQSETEYIDARPHQPASNRASCTARPDHTFGSFADGCPLYPLKADIGVAHHEVSFGPNSGSPQFIRSPRRHSSAAWGGTDRPRVLAVFRLMASIWRNA